MKPTRWYFLVAIALCGGVLAWRTLQRPDTRPIVPTPAGPPSSAVTPKNARIDVPGRDEREGTLQSPEPEKPARLLAVTFDPLPISARLDALHQRGPVTPAEQTALLNFVDGGGIPNGLSRSAYHHLINDIWNVLADAKASTLQAHLQQIADASQDPVIRDYALQHLSHQFLKGGTANSSELTVDPTTIRTLEESTKNTSGTLAGTSLLGLLAIANAEPQGPRKVELNQFLRDRAIAISSDPTAHETSRITALALCVDLREPAVLPEARRILTAPEADPQLRIVAARAIGTLGSPTDLPLLEQARTTLSHPLLFKAVDTATHQLTNPASGI